MKKAETHESKESFGSREKLNIKIRLRLYDDREIEAHITESLSARGMTLSLFHYFQYTDVNN